MTIEAFVRTSGEVMGQVRESFGSGGDGALSPPGMPAVPGQPGGTGQAADRSVDDANNVHRGVSALDTHDQAGSDNLAGAAAGSAAGRARMNSIIGAAVADVISHGMDVNTPQGRAVLVAALKRHLEDSKTTLDGAAADAGTRAASANSTAGGYNGIGPQAASLFGSAAPGLAGMAGAPTSMLSGIGGAMQMVPLAGLAHGTPHPQEPMVGDAAGISGAALTSDHSVAAGAVRRALAQLGKPYVWGGQGPSSFDCSGLVQYAYKGVGVDLPHHTYEQMRVGEQVPSGQARAGDLVFSNFSGLGRPEHVQLAIGGGQVVEAQQSGVPVKVSAMPAGQVVVKRVVA